MPLIVSERFRRAGAVLLAAVAAWLSLGAVAFATPDGPRIALLPLSPTALAAALGAGAAVLALLRAGAPSAPVWLLALVVLPWLPAPIPDAFLAWSGSLRVLVWVSVGGLLLVGLCRRHRDARGSWPWPLSAASPLVIRRPRTMAGVLALLIAGGAAWGAAPSVPGGDEPHYLVITQSLLLDGDLRIENNHQRGDYQEYFPGVLRPDYLRRGRDGAIYSIHAPGISAIVLPAFALGGYRGVVIFLVALAACGGALLWHVAWLATRNAQAAWFGWASIALASTWIFHTFTVYPDGVGGLLALTGVWALLRAADERRTGATAARPWLLHGLALALLPWLHTRFALLAGSLGALVLLRLAGTRNPAAKAVAFLAVPSVSALGWIGYFIAIYGVPDPSAPYGGAREFSAAYIPGGLAGLLFDQRFGLVANAPVLAFAVFGFAAMLIAGRVPSPAARLSSEAMPHAHRRLALELTFVIVPYLLTVTNYAMWWGGWSAPARFAAAIVPALVVPVAAAWAAVTTRAARVVALGALALTGFISTVLIVAERGRLAFNTREGYALWLDWASQLADLGQGMPAWFRDREPQFFTDIVVWTVLLIASGLAVRLIAHRRSIGTPEALATAAALVFAAAFMIALTVTWTLHGVSGTMAAPAQLHLLRRLSAEPRVAAMSLYPLALMTPEEITAAIRIEPRGRYVATGGAGRGDRPLLTLPAVPAGTYRIRPRTRGAGGMLMIGIGPDQFSLRTEPLGLPPDPIVIDFPVDVRALIVRGDEESRRAIREIAIEPISTRRPAERLTDEYARRAVRYATTAVYFLDDRSFPEPEAFWIGGARGSSVVLHPDEARGFVRLFLRNAPVNNTVVLEAGSWRETLSLAPGEEREIDVPIGATRRAALLRFTTSAGFRPSEVEPGSRDERFLGVWIRVE